MNIFIELPSWLGDAVMATAAIENIKKSYPDANITFFGSSISCEIFKPHPNAKRFIIDETKKSNFAFFIIISFIILEMLNLPLQ